MARAFLSDGYKIIDNLDVLMAALDGVRNSGFPVEIDGCDLTERRMYVRVVCEQVRVLAPALLAGYRSPFTGASGADNPVVFAGFVITNTETGCGAFTLTPRLVVQVCRNGMTITRDAMRAVHLGERLDEGVVTWSGNTQDKTLALITAKTTDAVATFLDPGYVERAVRAIEKDAGHPLADPQEAVRTVSQRLRFTDAQQNDILTHFIRGGDVTAGGVMHAVTSAAQTQRRRRHRPRDGVGGAARPGGRRRPVTPGPPAPATWVAGASHAHPTVWRLPCLTAPSRRCVRAPRPVTPTPPRSTTSTPCSPPRSPATPRSPTSRRS